MSALVHIVGLALLYFLVGRVAAYLEERNQYKYALVYTLQEIVVSAFQLSLWILAIIVALRA